MPYVIAEACQGVEDRACVDACPVDCIHPGTVELDGKVYRQLFIDPSDCIDCGACEPECPVGAIYVDHGLPRQWKEYEEINAEFYRTGTKR